MTRAVVCIAPRGRLSRRTAAEIRAGFPGAPLTALSIAGYLDSPRSGSRVVLCPAGRSVRCDLAFLRRVARRLLWPAPSADFRDAIGGLRLQPSLPYAAARSSTRRGPGGLLSALLLEGRVGPARARAALASTTPLDWIVESVRQVRLSPRLGRALERAGVRWSVLEPVEVIALYAGPELARAARQWRPLLPPKTPVWIRGAEVAKPSRSPRR